MIERNQVNRQIIWFVILVLIGIAAAMIAFPLSYFANTNVLIGLCLFPFTIVVTGPVRNNIFYLIALGTFTVLSLLYHVRIFYFFTLAFYLLWLTELLMGRLNSLVMFVVVFMSPFFIQVITILGFPLRLTLSAFAGSLLKSVGTDVVVDGNMMELGGAKFSVDEACMGLNMLAMSMLMGVFVLAYRYKFSKSSLGLLPSLIFFVIVFALNMLTNIMRIIVLVYFHIAPENPMHEIVGVICFIVYIVIPLHFLSGWFISAFGKTIPVKIYNKPGFSKKNLALVVLLPVVICCTAISLYRSHRSSAIQHADVQFQSSQPVKMADGVSKIVTDDLLIYVKAIPEFFTGEHTPLMCWKGSGYEFSGVTTVIIQGITVYKGTLENDGHLLYTAWWYSNGEIKTINQLDWRLRMLKGEKDFTLVNVTAADEQTLLNNLNAIFTDNSLMIEG